MNNTSNNNVTGSFPKFTGKNFAAFARAIQDLVTSRKLWSFLTGNGGRPSQMLLKALRIMQ